MSYVMQDGRTAVDVSADKTLTLADQGIVQNVVVDGKIITLPATSAGASFTVRNGGAAITSGGPAGAVTDGGVLVAVSPNASDKIQGLGFTATDNKDALNTKATSRVGDEVQLVGDGVDGYNVVRARGTWARET